MTDYRLEQVINQLHAIRYNQSLDVAEVDAIDFAIEALEAIQGLASPPNDDKDDG